MRSFFFISIYSQYIQYCRCYAQHVILTVKGLYRLDTKDTTIWFGFVVFRPNLEINIKKSPPRPFGQDGCDLSEANQLFNHSSEGTSVFVVVSVGAGGTIPVSMLSLRSPSQRFSVIAFLIERLTFAAMSEAKASM